MGTETLYDFLMCLLLVHIKYCLMQYGVNAFLSDFEGNYRLLTIIFIVKFFECSLFHTLSILEVVLHVQVSLEITKLCLLSVSYWINSDQ